MTGRRHPRAERGDRIGASALLLVAVVAAAGARLAHAGEEPPAEADLQPVLVAPLGHTQMLLSVAFSPDGRHVLTGSDDRTAKLWESATGREVRSFEGHERGVSSVAFSPDGTLVLTGSLDHTARLWEPTTGREIRRFAGHAGAVHAALFSPDGRFVLTASDDRTARLWDAATAAEIHRLAGHERPVLSAAFSPDGARLMTGSDDRTTRLWDTLSGREIRRFEGHLAGVSSLAFSPDGTHVLAGSWDRAARLWDVAAGAEVRRYEDGAMGSLSVRFSPDGGHVLAGSRDGRAGLWDTASGEVVARFEGHDGEVYAAAFSPDGRHVLTGAWDRTARLWETETGREVLRFQGQASAMETVAFTPDGASIVIGSRDATVGVWETSSGREVRHLAGHTQAALHLVPSRDGRRVLTGSRDGTARLWDTETGRELRRFEGHAAAVNAVALSPDGARALTGSDDETVRVWDTATGRETGRLGGHGATVHAVAFSPDGRLAVTGSRDGTVRLWDLAGERELRRLEGHGQWVTAVSFSPDGRHVLTASWDRTARLWETETGREIRRFEGHTKGVLDACFSPEGRQVLTGSFDETARVWEAATGEEVQRLEGHAGEVLAVAFAPDGRFALTGSADGTAGLWEVATGRRRCSLLSSADGTWAVVDACGRFDASHGGDVPGLHWVIGLDVIALDQLKDRYYEPGLLAKYLGRTPEAVREVTAFARPRLNPDVQVDERDGTLHIEVEDRGGGIGPVVVLLNGKELTPDARGPAVASDEGVLAVSADLKGDPRLLPGEENRVEVFAYNEEGYLRSRGVTVVYEPDGQKQAPSLWALVAGVADYRGEALDLTFAAKDAADFAAAVSTAGTALFGAERTHVTLLTDARASRDALQTALAGLRQAASGDILLVYLSGHGVSRDDGFYYLTADAASADLTDPALRSTTTLSSAELIDVIREIPALKQVLILDTCASGSFIDALTSRRAAPSSQARALERVKDRTGMFVLAGCASDKVSYEATQYGQGLLTYSLLLGMRGGQLREGEYVDVSTLFNYAADRVPEFARNVGGVQRPIVAAPRGGSSFDIGRLTEKERAVIPLESARPLFLRSSFLDPEEGADLIELGHRVDTALRGETARGPRAALVFVDAPNFPDAWRIAGTYTQAGGTTRARFKLRRDKEALTDWIEVVGPDEDLPGRILAEALAHLPARGR